MTSASSLACQACGAHVEFAAGTNVLRCPYCGDEQPVVPVARQVRELPLAESAPDEKRRGPHAFACERCGARTDSEALSQLCPFCGAACVLDASAAEQVAPEAVLPFEIDQSGVRTALRTWVSSRWFAPSSLKKVSEAESLQGIYLPHWTFDAQTQSHYDGQRGDDYWVTETYSVTVNGQSQTRTRQVRRTRWHDVSGSVERAFDDVLVCATDRFGDEELGALGDWPVPQAVACQPEYLAGYQTLRYDVEPQTALGQAKDVMAGVIEGDCRRDIGGDRQEVSTVDTQYSAVTHKLLLLPVWIVCYVYAGKRWQVIVNASTGATAGQRPYSTPKIAAAVAAALALIALVIYAMVRSSG